MKVELVTNPDTKSYWWRIVATNGQILLTSETYKRKATRTRVARKFAAKTGLPLVEVEVED